MAPLKASCFSSVHRPLISTRNPRIFEKPSLQISSPPQLPTFLPLTPCKKANFKIFTALSPTSLSAQESLSPDHEIESEKFDWYSHWYPVVPICDLDKRRPHAKKVIGMDLVIWWDRNVNEWRVFDDSCPHRLAPLSEGRIDRRGRLQCVYHGWCFGGSGDCKFVPQAPRDGPPIHTSQKACVAVYPSCVQNGILWFWPNSDPQYKDIYSKKKPHYIPELDDPSYTNMTICRDLPYGYEVLMENIVDPAHAPYSHYRILKVPEVPGSLKADREGGIPIEISVKKLDANGFTAKQTFGDNFFVAPCLHYACMNRGEGQNKNKIASAGTADELSPTVPAQRREIVIFYCIPVSPGNSRLIFAAPRNFDVWIERILPRWILHIGHNLILDSDLYLLHMEEHKLMEVGSLNWHKSCYVSTKADALVVSFRRWLNKYAGTQVDWRNKYSGLLPPPPPPGQIFDKYWTHTASCSSCSAAHKQLRALEIVLQISSISLLGVFATAKQGTMTFAARYGLVSMAVLSFVASKWLSQFIYKTFQYNEYDHAFL